MRFLALFCFSLLCVHATAANPLDDNAPCFNIKQANQTFEQISLKLSTQNLSQPDLKAAVDTLSKLTDQAEKCMENAQKKLSSLDIMMQQGVSTADKNTTGADLLYLANEKKSVANQQSQCRLFAIRAKEAIEAYKTALAQLTQAEALTRSLPLWTIINTLIKTPPQDVFGTLSQLQLPPSLQSPLLWLTLGCTALLLSLIFVIKMRNNRFLRHYLPITKLRVSHILLFSACLIVGAVFLYLFIFLQDATVPNVFLELTQQLFFYLSACLFIVFFFKLKHVKALRQSYSIDSDFIRKCLLFFITFYTLSTTGHILAQTLNIHTLLLQLNHSLFVLAMLASGIYFIYYFCTAHRHVNFIKHHKQLIQRLGVLLLLACAMINVLGYDALAIRLTSSGLLTCVIILITVLIVLGINKIYFILNHESAFKTQIMHYFGYKTDQVFTEFLILKTTLQMIVIAISVFLIVLSWGFATYYLENAYTQLLYGIHLAGITIYPTRIVLGVLVYCLLYLLFRAISTAISRHQQFEDEEETQVAVASIFTYLGFSLALLSALLVAGFNFTGLAIIAGALSVGIGLGLQSIVNNFVSGLILLIEKPIKPGDRIQIDNIEGFVKKIRVRSTHLITPAFEDIIVPNSDLITRQVTNYVYSNKQIAIRCEINVPLGRDAKRIRDVLLQAANEHEDVIKGGRNKPYVLFRSFGEKTLTFELCCLIKDVNKKSLVQSDLNFAIDQLLREDSIQ